MKRPAPTRDVAAPESGRWPLGAMFAVFFVVALLAYFPALQGNFLWDDAGHVTNPALQSWSGLRRIWFEPGTTQQYYPLLHTAFWFEHRVWGDATIGYHLINVLWHVTSACLLVAILRTLAIRTAVLAALIFALHPVAVESVAWIAEQKNTLTTANCLAPALAWCRFEKERKPSHYSVASHWFHAALLTKTVTATLPPALLVVAWWRRGRLSWRGDVLPLLRWFAVGIAAGFGTAWLESTQIGANGGDFNLSAVARGLLAGRVIWFYLGKLLWPAGLTFFYPRWTIDPTAAWQWLFPGAALALLGVCFWWRKRDRAPIAAALLFGGTLFPVLGFVNVYPFVFSYVADHFQYLASLGLIAFLTAAAVQGFLLLGWPRWSGLTVAAGVLLLLGGLTWRQSGVYRDGFSLYEATLARNPSCWAAQLNLGTALDDTGRVAESLPHLQRALDLKPDFPETLNSLGNVLNHLGRFREAEPLLERAVRIQPRFAAAHNTLGVSLMALGRPGEGITQFQRALELNPGLTSARVNFGWALANNGDRTKALEQLELARRQQPDLADAEFKTGLVLAMNGHLGEALPHFSRAVELQPEQPEMRYLFGRALLDVGKRAEAVEQFKETLRLNPNHVGANQALDDLQLAGATNH